MLCLVENGFVKDTLASIPEIFYCGGFEVAIQKVRFARIPRTASVSGGMEASAPRKDSERKGTQLFPRRGGDVLRCEPIVDEEFMDRWHFISLLEIN